MMLVLRGASRLVCLAAVASALALGGCASRDRDLDPNAPMDFSKTDEELRVEAARAYLRAREALDSGDYQSAAQMYGFVSQRYPFTDFGAQSELERVYALYRTYQTEEALSAAENFLRDHPRHAKADYVQYLKGLINSDRRGGLMNFLNIDDTRVDIGYDRAAFDDFALLAQRYPDSIYVADARQRMIFLRNRIADHEFAIADFYFGRGAYIAAAERASRIISTYPGAPITYESLALMERSYRRAGLLAQADDAHRVMQAQSMTVAQANAAGEAVPQGPGLMRRLGHALTFGLFDDDDANVETRPEDPAPPPPAASGT